MAESNPRHEFQTKRKLFDKIANDVTCFVCQIVPRKAPIFRSTNGTIVCSLCKSSVNADFHQDFTLEKMLFDLPISCKFQKNDCKIVLDRCSIENHEEDCEYRNIYCVYEVCNEICPARELSDHLKNKHQMDISLPSKYVEENGSYYFVKFSINKLAFSVYEEKPNNTGQKGHSGIPLAGMALAGIPLAGIPLAGTPLALAGMHLISYWQKKQKKNPNSL